MNIINFLVDHLIKAGYSEEEAIILVLSATTTLVNDYKHKSISSN